MDKNRDSGIAPGFKFEIPEEEREIVLSSVSDHIENEQHIPGGLVLPGGLMADNEQHLAEPVPVLPVLQPIEEDNNQDQGAANPNQNNQPLPEQPQQQDEQDPPEQPQPEDNPDNNQAQDNSHF